MVIETAKHINWDWKGCSIDLRAGSSSGFWRGEQFVPSSTAETRGPRTCLSQHSLQPEGLPPAYPRETARNQFIFRFTIAGLLAVFVIIGISACSILFNSEPVASFVASPLSGPAPLLVIFDASASYDPDGYIVEFRWSFGDGGVGYGENISHFYAQPGSYVVSLTVKDNRGAINSTSRSIEVTAAAPQTYDRYFAWQSDGSNWHWELHIPCALYSYYNSREDRYYCTTTSCDWYKYVMDPYDDDYIESLSFGLQAAMEERYGNPSWLYYKVLQFTLDFVTAAIPYIKDYPPEWPKYPVETLVEIQGDCEDTAILYASLVRPIGYGVHLLFLPRHVAVGVPVHWSFIENAPYRVGYYTWDNQYYVYVETTADPPNYIEVGYLPSNLVDAWLEGDWWLYDVSQRVSASFKTRIHIPQRPLETQNWLTSVVAP